MSAPRAKARMQKPQGGGQIFGANPRGCAGRMVIDKIDTCIILPKRHFYILLETKGVQDFLVGNLKFDSGGYCETMALRIIRTRGIYKNSWPA